MVCLSFPPFFLMLFHTSCFIYSLPPHAMVMSQHQHSWYVVFSFFFLFFMLSYLCIPSAGSTFPHHNAQSPLCNGNVPAPVAMVSLFVFYFILFCLSFMFSLQALDLGAYPCPFDGTSHPYDGQHLHATGTCQQ
jgi:hypothetical protein